MKFTSFSFPLALGVLLFTGRIQATAEPGTPTTAAPVTDPSVVAQHYHEVAGRPQFQDAGDAAISSGFEEWLSQWFRRLGGEIGSFAYSSQMPAFESLLMALLVAFSISVLIYILMRLTRRRRLMDPEAASAEPGAKAFHLPEFYEEEIRRASEAGDWHTAWLASWRQFLSRLENRDLVEADRTRTNREYLAQLREKSLPATALSNLNALVDAYDRFIYGQAVIGKSDWNQFHQHIDEAALLLHLDDKRASTPPDRNAA